MRDYKGFKVPTLLEEIYVYTVSNHPGFPNLCWAIGDKENNIDLTYAVIKLDVRLEDVGNTHGIAEKENELFEYCIKSIEQFIDDRISRRQMKQ